MSRLIPLLMTFGLFTSSALTLEGSVCKSRNLTLSVTKNVFGVGGGRVSTDYVFTNRGPIPCTLQGYPSARALDANGKATRNISFARLAYVIDAPVEEKPDEVLLPVEGHAWFQVLTSDGTGLDDMSLCDKAHTMEITPPGNVQPFTLKPAFTSCGGAQITFVVPGLPPKQ